jgi:hypothetical protein
MQRLSLSRLDIYSKFLEIFLRHELILRLEIPQAGKYNFSVKGTSSKIRLQRRSVTQFLSKPYAGRAKRNVGVAEGFGRHGCKCRVGSSRYVQWRRRRATHFKHVSFELRTFLLLPHASRKIVNWIDIIIFLFPNSETYSPSLHYRKLRFQAKLDGENPFL